ncbi:MAG: ATP-binding cassette domain-containing protein [Oscillospiraceae bacterium]
MTPLVQCENLLLSYGGHIAVNALSFTVMRGDYLCIIGENGSGKTTLLRALLGLLRPKAGVIHYYDGLTPRDIGYLPQQTALQRDFPASVREVTLSGRLGRKRFSPFYNAEDRRRAAVALERMGISHLEHYPYSDLSGGQRQRVLLARALCAAQDLLLLDEPAAALDPEATAGLDDQLASLNAEGITLIIVTHDLLAARRAKTILHLGTESLWMGSVTDYFTNGPGGTRHA